MTDAIYAHERDQTGVMNFNALHLTRSDQISPLAIDLSRIRKEIKHLFEVSRDKVYVPNLQAEAVAGRWPRGDIPKFGHVLEGIRHWRVARFQLVNSGPNLREI